MEGTLLWRMQMRPWVTVTMSNHDKCLLWSAIDEPWKGHPNEQNSSPPSELLSQGLSLNSFFSKNKADLKVSGLS